MDLISDEKNHYNLSNRYDSQFLLKKGVPSYIFTILEKLWKLED